MESIELHGFSQGELAGRRETFIDRLFTGERFASHTSTVTRSDYLERAISGGYPGPLTRTTERRRTMWMDNYLSGIVKRDARDISGLNSVDDLPLLLRVLAPRNSEELNVADVSKDCGILVTSLKRLHDLLEMIGF